MRSQGNANNRGRYRNVYNATGVPGWVRYGRSPGYTGGGRGMGPCAEYLQRTGQMDEFLKDLTEKNPPIQNDAPLNQWNFQASNEIALKERINLLENELKDLKKSLKDRRY
ncbi:MAG: hypothetical protein JXA54_01920 [Candidatus Heimdallarchaeota archaeon]|nr:hypothetical protein [Candidatus Heimdallarchaeota archaeon]